ncbi:LysR substrate-binding domain-containing protein [Sinorhizobium fredii]
MDHSSYWRNLPSLDALRAVLAAERTGSFSRAADDLDITHGAVSRRVAAVEQWAGMPLFERHGRGVRLTTQGQHLVRLLQQGLDTIGSGGAEWRESKLPEAIRVSVLPSFARLCLLPNLAVLEGSPPDLRIDLDLDHRFVPLDEIDLAIRYGRGPWKDGSATALFEERLFPVASPGIAAALGDCFSVDDLMALPLIHDAYPDAWRLWLAEHGCRYHLRPQDRCFPDYDLGLQAAAAGSGVALMREPYGASFLKCGSLARLAGHTVASPLHFWVVTGFGARRRGVQSFIARLLELARSGRLTLPSMKDSA